MVNQTKSRAHQSGVLTVELVVALAILTLAMMPLAYSFTKEHKLQHSSYQRAVAMELVDGEMEVLLAGEWRAYKEGAQPYIFHADSVKNLPEGHATLTITGKHLLLDWKPASRASGGEIRREADVR